MKSILIIETPKDCGGCPCIHDELWMCQVDKEYREANYSGRPSWCPLKPLPLKGYGDEDDFEQTTYFDGWNDCLKEITE